VGLIGRDKILHIKIMTTARDTIVDALDIESFVLCAGGRERQRRSVIQPRVGACAYPGSAAQSSTTLKGLHPRHAPTRYNPFRVENIFHRLPRVARASQPWADGLERRWRSPELHREMRDEQNFIFEKFSNPEFIL
jgi:hypothetical protein